MTPRKYRVFYGTRIIIIALQLLIALSRAFSKDALSLPGNPRFRLETGATFDGMANLYGATALAQASVELWRLRLGLALAAQHAYPSSWDLSSGILLGMGQNMAMIFSADWRNLAGSLFLPTPRVAASFDLVPPQITGFYIAALAAWTDPRAFFSGAEVEFDELYGGISFSLMLGFQYTLRGHPAAR